MTEDDFENRSQSGEIRRDPKNGKFLPGTAAGPGRPHGSINIFRACKIRARREGMDLRNMVWEVAKGLAEAAMQGDAAAAKVLFDRFGGPVERSPEVTVNVATQIQAGPKPPEPGKMRDYLAKLNEIAAEQGLLDEPELDSTETTEEGQ
jgi:hypothetical protein